MGLTEAARDARAETASPTLAPAEERIERPSAVAWPEPRRFPFGQEPAPVSRIQHDTDPMELAPFDSGPWAQSNPTTEPVLLSPPRLPTIEPPPRFPTTPPPPSGPTTEPPPSPSGPTTEPPPSWATPILGEGSAPVCDAGSLAERISSPAIGRASESTEAQAPPGERTDPTERRPQRRERIAVISIFMVINVAGWVVMLARDPLPLLTARHWPDVSDRAVIAAPATTQAAPPAEPSATAAPSADRRCRPVPTPSRKAPRRKGGDVVDPWAR